MGGDVIAEINYLTHTIDGSPPRFLQGSMGLYVKSNFAPSSTRVTIHDLRDKERSLDLDTHGMELLKYDGSVQDEFKEGSEEQRAHYEEISDLLKKHLGASRVIIYHHVFRARGPPRTLEEINENQRNPVFYPHLDVDPAGAHVKMKELLGEEEAERKMGHRFQVINVWRPVGSHTLTDKPLAICDYRSVNPAKDVHQLEIQGPMSITTAYTMSCNDRDAHQWYYLSKMRSDEMFVFKMFDSKSDVAQFAFHTAFINEHEPPSNVDQKSLEMRCLVCYD